MCFSNTCTVVIFWKQCKLLLWNTNRILYSSWMQCNKLLCCWCRLRAFKGMEILVASVLKSIPGVVLCSAHNKWQMALGHIIPRPSQWPAPNRDTFTTHFRFFLTRSLMKICALLKAVLSGCSCDHPSHLWSTPTQFKISKYFSYSTVERCFKFLDAKFYSFQFRNSPRTNALKRGSPLSKAKIWPVIHNNLEIVQDAMYVCFIH